MALAQGRVPQTALHEVLARALAGALLGVQPGSTTVEHVLRGAALLGYPVAGRAVGLITRGIPAEIELVAGQRPGAVEGALRWFGPALEGTGERAFRAAVETGKLYGMYGDRYRQTLASMLAGALLRAQALGSTPLAGRGRVVLDLLKIVPRVEGR